MCVCVCVFIPVNKCKNFFLKNRWESRKRTTNKVTEFLISAMDLIGEKSWMAWGTSISLSELCSHSVPADAVRVSSLIFVIVRLYYSLAITLKTRSVCGLKVRPSKSHTGGTRQYPLTNYLFGTLVAKKYRSCCHCNTSLRDKGQKFFGNFTKTHLSRFTSVL